MLAQQPPGRAETASSVGRGGTTGDSGSIPMSNPSKTGGQTRMRNLGRPMKCVLYSGLEDFRSQLSILNCRVTCPFLVFGKFGGGGKEKKKIFPPDLF